MKTKFCFVVLCVLGLFVVDKSLAQTKPKLGTKPEIQVLTKSNNDIRAIAFSTQKNVLATGGFDSVVRLWDTDTGRIIRSLKVNNSSQDAVHSLEFSPDGKTLVTGGKYVQLWDVSTGRLKLKLADNPTGRREDVDSLSFSHDGQLLAVSRGIWRPQVQLWDLKTGNWLQTILSSVTSTRVKFSPSEDLLITASHLNTELFNVKSKRKTEIRYGGLDANVESVAFSPDGKTLAIAGDTTPYKEEWSVFDYGGFTGEVHIHDVKTGRLLKTIKHYEERCNSVAFSSDGASLAVGHDERIRIWSTRTWQLRQAKELPADAVSYSPDGKTLAFISEGKPMLWHFRQWKRGHLGVTIKTVPLPSSAIKVLNNQSAVGVLLMECAKYGPATRAGLLKGDIVLNLNKKPVQSAEDLAHQLHLLRSGDLAEIEVWRGTKIISVTAKLDTDE